MQQGKPPQLKLPETTQSPNKPRVPPPRLRPPPREELSPPALRSQVHYLSAFFTSRQAKKYLQDSFCPLADFRADARSLTHTARQRQAPQAHRAASLRHRNVPWAPPQQVLLKIWPFACEIPPLKFGQIFTLFFIKQLAAPRKGNAKPPPTLTARQRPLHTATPRAPSTLQPQRARTKKISSSRTTPQKS